MLLMLQSNCWPAGGSWNKLRSVIIKTMRLDLETVKKLLGPDLHLISSSVLGHRQHQSYEYLLCLAAQGPTMFSKHSQRIDESSFNGLFLYNTERILYHYQMLSLYCLL